jgi:hypothetical protein
MNYRYSAAAAAVKNASTSLQPFPLISIAGALVD